MLGVTLQWTRIRSRRGVEGVKILLVASCYQYQDRLIGHQVHMQTFDHGQGYVVFLSFSANQARIKLRFTKIIITKEMQYYNVTKKSCLIFCKCSLGAKITNHMHSVL